MYGAIIGDICGSVYEFYGNKDKGAPLFADGCDVTDDTIMTCAVASALMISRREQSDFPTVLVREMQRLGQIYPYPKGSYGGRFAGWLFSPNPQPYYSWGNGSAMRVSPCGLIAGSLEEALDLSAQSAGVTHDHPEGIRGAQAAGGAVYLAKTGATKQEIRDFITSRFYPLPQTVEEIRADYCFDESCQGTVPQAITAFLESRDYEDAIRNAISLGGDADTIGAITGSIAWACYGRDGLTPAMEDMKAKAQSHLRGELLRIVDDFTGFVA